MATDEREWRLRRREVRGGLWTVDLHRHPSRDHENIVTVVPKSRVNAAEQRVRELEELNRQRNLRDGQMIAVEQQRATRAEAKLATAVEALREIDKAAPAKEHWYGDSMWANIGRLAGHVARRALSEIEQGDAQ